MPIFAWQIRPYMMKKPAILLLLCLSIFSSNFCHAQDAVSELKYTYKQGDPNGTGKWYLGREIAHVMGYQGMGWLVRPEREREENTSILLQNMDIRPEDIIADIGAGAGYHVFKMAKLAPEGRIYAVDIQDGMLAELSRRKSEEAVANVEVVKGSENSINLTEDTLDKILMVDVYHEFSFPVQMMASIRAALKPDGKVFLIEYRGEDPGVPIKKVHKMTENQAILEMGAAGFRLEQNKDNLPWQHCMVFVKK
jgi:SAM-dependent methyltransferase